MPNVAEYLSPNLYGVFFRHLYEEGSRTWAQKQVAQVLEDGVREVLFAFLIALREKGRLGAAPDADHLLLRRAGAWNAFVNRKYTDRPDAPNVLFDKPCGEPFHAHDITSPAYTLLFGAIKKQYTYERACKVLNTGNLSRKGWGSEMCQKTGTYVFGALDGWALGLSLKVNNGYITVNPQTLTESAQFSPVLSHPTR